MAEHCLKSAKDLSGLLLLYSARGSAGGLATLTSAALEGGKNNVAFGANRIRVRVGFQGHTFGAVAYGLGPKPDGKTWHLLMATCSLLLLCTSFAALLALCAEVCLSTPRSDSVLARGALITIPFDYITIFESSEQRASEACLS